MVWDCYKERDINATPLKMWDVLKDVEHWPVWDVDLKKSYLKNPATEDLEGAEGVVEMNNGRVFPFVLHDIDKERYVAYKTELPGATADWYWDYGKFNANSETITLRMGVKFTGFATFLYRFMIGAQAEKAFEICTQNLKNLLEKGSVDTSTK